MTLDFRSLPAPEEWERFEFMLRRRMPRLPSMGGGSAADSLGDGLTMAGAATSGLGSALPGSVGGAVGLAGTAVGVAGAVSEGDYAGAARTAGEDLIGRGADMMLSGEGGWLVGGLIMVARGFHQSLSRSDEMVAYLNSMGGYIQTLVRASIGAVNDPTPYTRMPLPIVPEYVERTGDLYSRFAREAFTEGYRRIATCVREIDEVRPPHGDYPSKRCLMHIGLQTNMTGGSRGDTRLMRQRAERYVVDELLQVDMTRQANELRRWANAH